MDRSVILLAAMGGDQMSVLIRATQNLEVLYAFQRTHGLKQMHLHPTLVLRELMHERFLFGSMHKMEMTGTGGLMESGSAVVRIVLIECGVVEGSGTGIIVSFAVSTGVGIRSRGYRRVCVTNGCILPISTPGPMYRFM